MELSELVTEDVFVVSLTATDKDSGLNGNISYRLLSSLLQGFYIQPDTGKKKNKDANLAHVFMSSCAGIHLLDRIRF